VTTNACKRDSDSDGINDRLEVVGVNINRLVKRKDSDGGYCRLTVRKSHPLDRGMLTRLADVVSSATKHLEAYDYTAALRDTETFFWWFCDDHIEHVKRRRAADGPHAASATGR
jgi:valyl-tRNA synthetase